MAEMASRYIYRDVTTTSYNTGYFAERWRKRNRPQINRWGFRERNLELHPLVGTCRIALVGDSITYGQGIRGGMGRVEVSDDRRLRDAII